MGADPTGEPRQARAAATRRENAENTLGDLIEE
jgi:hypothetical protein